MRELGTHFFRVLSLVALCFGLGACAAQLVRTPVPVSLIDEASVPGLPDVRYWGDELPKNITERLRVSTEQSEARRPHLFKRGQRRTANFLAISGGGRDGAFGAGLLAGWSETGKRPEFDLVTGISTGALAAPFAFLGPAYDRQLREIYTSYSTDDLVEPQLIAGLLGGASVADATKFRKVVAKYVNMNLLRAIAIEHAKGRRLLIGTTNLDAERPVVWDMGEIAKRGDRAALKLFRDVLQASASIPGIFPPVVVNVEAGGQVLQELHVDGGTTGQVFFLPSQLLFASIAPKKIRKNIKNTDLNLYIIMNTPLNPRYATTTPKTTSIAQRSVYTMMKQQAISDLYKIYIEAKNNRIDYHLASVPEDFTLESKEPFDRAYMTALFDKGQNLARNTYNWSKAPPGLTASAR